MTSKLGAAAQRAAEAMREFGRALKQWEAKRNPPVSSRSDTPTNEGSGNE